MNFKKATQVMTDPTNLRIQPSWLSSASPTIMGISGVLLFAQTAFAHPGHGLMSFVAGVAQPLTGLDHLLTALAIGFLAVGPTSSVNLKIPAGFIAAVTCGILAGQMGLVLPFYDQGIAISLGLIGICLFFGAYFFLLEGCATRSCFGVHLFSHRKSQLRHINTCEWTISRAKKDCYNSSGTQVRWKQNGNNLTS